MEFARLRITQQISNLIDSQFGVTKILFSEFSPNLDNQASEGDALFNIGLGGLLLCLLVRRTGHLWIAIGFHTSWNWAEGFLYGTPVSGQTVPGHLLNSTVSGQAWLTGGAVGPEGSFFCTLVIIVLFIGSARRFREAKYLQ